MQHHVRDRRADIQMKHFCLPRRQAPCVSMSNLEFESISVLPSLGGSEAPSGKCVKLLGDCRAAEKTAVYTIILSVHIFPPAAAFQSNSV